MTNPTKTKAARRQEIAAFLGSLSQEEKDARDLGTFFSNVEDLWDPIATTIDRTWYRSIVRTRTQGLTLYPETLNDDNLEYPMAPTESSDATNTNQLSTRFDLFRNFGAEKVHLLSNARLCHKAFGYIAEAATGKVDCTKETRLKLLNGVKRTNDTRKGAHYDSRPPSMITIPLLEIEDVLDWNGTDEYDVMAITFGEDAPFCQMQVLSKADKIQGSLAQVKVEQGRQLLETFIKGLASSNLQHLVEENFGKDEGRTYQPYQQWLRLLAEVRDASHPKMVELPQEITDLDWTKVSIAVGRADLNSSLPDPFNMAVKAAINYSSYRGTALLPSCPPPLETSSDGEINTLQGNENRDSGIDDGRDFSAVARSFSNPNRTLVEIFSSE